MEPQFAAVLQPLKTTAENHQSNAALSILEKMSADVDHAAHEYSTLL
jgi:hypothetical protein